MTEANSLHGTKSFFHSLFSDWAQVECICGWKAEVSGYEPQFPPSVHALMKAAFDQLDRHVAAQNTAKHSKHSHG